MARGKCPNCGGAVEVERCDGATFRCGNCHGEFRLVLKNGKFTVRPIASAHAAQPVGAAVQRQLTSQRAQSAPPAVTRSVPEEAEPSYWANMTTYTDVPRTVEPPPRAASRPQPKAAAPVLEVLPRTGWFLLLIVLFAVDLLNIPMFQLVWNRQDVTLPGIGTLRGKADLEYDNLAAITAGHVTETKEILRLKKGDSFQVRYEFEVDGQWYTASEGTAGQDSFEDIDHDLWVQLDQSIKKGGKPTLEIRYLRSNPWDNRPVAGYSRVNDAWMFVWIVIGFFTLVSLEQAGHAYVNYSRAQKAAQKGKVGKMSYWEVRAKKV